MTTAIDKEAPIPHNTLWRKRNKLVKIRLRRIGAKKSPSYRIVVADSRAPRDGAFIAAIGHYNPLTDPETIIIDQEKAQSWLKSGAQPTDTAARLLAKAGIIEEPPARKEKMQAGAPKGKVSKKKKAKAEAPKAEAAAEEPKAEAAAAEPKAEAAEEPKAEVTEEPEASQEEPEAGVAQEAEASATEEPKASKEGAETGTKAEPATSEEPSEPSTETSEEPS
jgi:small subunit ribosomal protein S16